MNEDTRHSKKLAIEIFAAVHLVLSVFCAVWAMTTPSWLLSFLWALGPAANLVHGTMFLVPFLGGTVLVTLLFLLTVFARPILVRRLAAFFLPLAWLAFGILAYAPGA
jgi:hypothetical protein